jgi:hypothetical protein
MGIHRLTGTLGYVSISAPALHCFVWLVVLGFELGASRSVRCSTTLPLQPLYVLGVFEIGSHFFAQAGLELQSF